MDTADGEDGSWLRQRFGSGAWEDLSASQRATWLGVGLAGSLVLLGAFWLVLHQAKERANHYWAETPRAVRSESCGAAGLDDPDCAPAAGQGSRAGAGAQAAAPSR